MLDIIPQPFEGQLKFKSSGLVRYESALSYNIWISPISTHIHIEWIQ